MTSSHRKPRHHFGNILLALALVGGGFLWLATQSFVVQAPPHDSPALFVAPTIPETALVLSYLTPDPTRAPTYPATSAVPSTSSPEFVSPTPALASPTPVYTSPSKTALYPIPTSAAASPQTSWKPPCAQPGWFPEHVGLKDHTVFWFDGYYYLASIYLPSQSHRFAYARSRDLCNWDELDPILTEVELPEWDGMDIWAPFVIERDNLYYMFYTGVTWNMTQRIMLAISTNPAQPSSWFSMGAVFRPEHLGMKWIPGGWADCRDASILEKDGVFYMYYTGSDLEGGILGVATSSSLLGPWSDQGAVIGPLKGEMMESPIVVFLDRVFYLFYNHTRRSEYYRVAESPVGPWSDPTPLEPGWAHEVWQARHGEWYTSYLTGYTVTIAPLAWEQSKGQGYDFVSIGSFSP